MIKKTGLSEKLEKLGFYTEKQGSGTEISLSGNRELTVWAHSGILCADENLVSVKCGEFTLHIYGRELAIDTVCKNGTVVRGVISSISF